MLKVASDFYGNDLKVGDVVPIFAGKLKIIDLHYQNRYGEFIICESVGGKKNRADGWETETGVKPSEESRFEIIGTIHVPHYQNLMAGIGYYVKDHHTQEVTGLSYRETWERVFREGAKNAISTISTFNKFSSRLLDTIEELPSLDSHYWKIPAYGENGECFAPLSKQASRELKKGLQYASENMAREAAAHYYFETNVTESDLKDLKNQIELASKIAVLTGAGISTLSGIPDYRSVTFGMWQKDPALLDYLNEETFRQDPLLFWNMLYHHLTKTLSQVMPFPIHDSLIASMKAIKPNITHTFFAWLEKEKAKEVTVVTQNVDGLHQKAGSNKVIEFHGNLWTCHCTECGETYQIDHVLKKDKVPICSCGAVLRPDVVFFGDQVKEFEQAIEAVKEADLVIVAGTSLQVYPFYTLLEHIQSDVKLVYINGEAPENTERFDYILTGNLSTVFSRLKELF